MGVIKIHGPIGSYKNEKGVLIVGLELADVVAQVQGDNDEVLVFEVNSIGGLVSVGYAIRDYMSDLRREGRTINTLGNGVVGSISTVIFLAGTERKIIKGTVFSIHNPYATVQGDADQLQQYAKGLAAAEADMAKFYSQVTGVSAVAMDLLMKEDQPMDSARAVELKFATEEIDGTLNVEFKQMAMVAALKIPEMKVDKKPETAIEKMLAILLAKFSTDAKNLMVTTDDGKSLEVEGEEIRVGALVTLDGSPTPSATYKLVDGSTFKTDAEGKITEVTEADVVEAKLGDVVKDENGKIIEEGESVLANGTKVKTNKKGEIISMEAGEPVKDSALQVENKALKEEIETLKTSQKQTDKNVEKLASLIGSDFTPERRATIFGKKIVEDGKGGDSDSISTEDIKANRDAKKKKRAGATAE